MLTQRTHPNVSILCRCNDKVDEGRRHLEIEVDNTPCGTALCGMQTTQRLGLARGNRLQRLHGTVITITKTISFIFLNMFLVSSTMYITWHTHTGHALGLPSVGMTAAVPRVQCSGGPPVTGCIPM